MSKIQKDRYVACYRCGLCGEIIYPVKAGVITSHSEAIKMTQDIYWGLSDTSKYPRQVYHECQNGSIGSATFIGMGIIPPEPIVPKKSKTE